MKRIDSKIKEAVLNEHQAGTGHSPNEFVMIRKSPIEKNRYFVYWMDGEIERRDTYFVVDTKDISLEAMYQRENNTWIHLQ